jgi:hypothetical protein
VNERAVVEQETEHPAAKVPEVTLLFWVLKLAATTLGETGGDTLSMTMNLGYLTSTAIFGALFAACVAAQIRAKHFHPFLYWFTIVATTTVGTTLADFADRSLGIGYTGGSALLLVLLLGSLFVWYRTLGTVAVDTIRTPKAEVFYWVTIMFSQTLGTALGDWTADSAGLGYTGRGGDLRLAARPARGALFLDAHLAHVPVLGGVHPDAADGRGARRLPRQAREPRRPRAQPSARIGCIVRVHDGPVAGVQAAPRTVEPLSTPPHAGLLGAIGNTAIVRLGRVVPPRCATVLVKLEFQNPTGSLKDRMALAVISRAEADGRLRPGDTVVEYTGGSTGASLALVCAARATRSASSAPMRSAPRSSTRWPRSAPS